MTHPSAPETAATDQIGVVVMAYGTPRTPDEIEPYYTDIRRGRPPTPELLAELVGRYAAIGGISPLAQRTEAQRDGITAALEALDPGRFIVGIGLKHADPKIEATVDALAARGVRRLVGVVLAPHDSQYSVGQYLGRMEAAAEPHGITCGGVRSWATEPAFVEFIAADLGRRLERAPERCRVIFTAHSLPERIMQSGDPYPDQLRATAEAVATRLGLDDATWELAWQSAGRTPEPWLGPDILERLDQLAAETDPVDGVIVSAVGFTADHLEVLYDLDIEAAARAEQLGIAFDRTACVNDDPTVLAALAARVHAEAEALG